MIEESDGSGQWKPTLREEMKMSMGQLGNKKFQYGWVIEMQREI